MTGLLPNALLVNLSFNSIFNLNDSAKNMICFLNICYKVQRNEKNVYTK